MRLPGEWPIIAGLDRQNDVFCGRGGARDLDLRGGLNVIGDNLCLNAQRHGSFEGIDPFVMAATCVLTNDSDLLRGSRFFQNGPALSRQAERPGSSDNGLRIGRILCAVCT